MHDATWCAQKLHAKQWSACGVTRRTTVSGLAKIHYRDCVRSSRPERRDISAAISAVRNFTGGVTR